MGLWLRQGVTDPEEARKPARQKVYGARTGIGTGSLEGVREVVWPLSVHLVRFGCVSGDYAQVIRLEVLFSMGSRRCRGFAVPVRLCLPAWAWSGFVHRASSVAAPSVAHFDERLGSMRRDHSLTHPRIKTRSFQLINAQILKAHSYPNPSQHPSPRRAWRRKLVFKAETGEGRVPRGPHAQRGMTAVCEREGSYEPAPGLQDFLSKIPPFEDTSAPANVMTIQS